jgi:hypothetical protein
LGVPLECDTNTGERLYVKPKARRAAKPKFKTEVTQTVVPAIHIVRERKTEERSTESNT